MEKWDADATRRDFANIAQSAENYANELWTRIRKDGREHSDYEKELHDEHRAKWYVYDSLSLSSSTRSRAALLAEVQRRLDSGFGDPPMHSCFNGENFLKFWRQHLMELNKSL